MTCFWRLGLSKDSRHLGVAQQVPEVSRTSVTVTEVPFLAAMGVCYESTPYSNLSARLLAIRHVCCTMHHVELLQYFELVPLQVVARLTHVPNPTTLAQRLQ